MDYTKLVGKAVTTILSYPERDPQGKTYGKPGWAGNCSGLLIKDLSQWAVQNHFPRRSRSAERLVFFDPMGGSGTSKDVWDEMGLRCHVMDLNPAPPHPGVIGRFNARLDEAPESYDFAFVHPPYHDMYVYSASQWASKTPDPHDLSTIPNYWDFIRAWNEVQLRIFADLRSGGLMAVLVGDIKKHGALYSMQRDMAWLGQPKQVIVKTQHNTRSDKRQYGIGGPGNGAMSWIPIVHEYLLLFEKEPGMVVTIRKTVQVGYDLMKWSDTTWKSLIRGALERLGGKATLSSLYAALKDTPKAKKNPTFEATIRRTLQESPDFRPVEKGSGVWKLAA